MYASSATTAGNRPLTSSGARGPCTASTATSGRGAHRVGDLRPVGRVGDQQVALRGPVDDQVVDDRALVGEAQRVLGGAECIEAVQVAREGVLEGGAGTRAAHLDLAEVGEIEDADGLADGAVLAERAGVLDGHLPAGERAHLGAEPTVDGIQRGALALLRGSSGHSLSLGGGVGGVAGRGRGVREGGREVRTGGGPSLWSRRSARPSAFILAL